MLLYTDPAGLELYEKGLSFNATSEPFTPYTEEIEIEDERILFDDIFSMYVSKILDRENTTGYIVKGVKEMIDIEEPVVVYTDDCGIALLKIINSATVTSAPVSIHGFDKPVIVEKTLLEMQEMTKGDNGLIATVFEYTGKVEFIYE